MNKLTAIVLTTALLVPALSFANMGDGKKCAMCEKMGGGKGMMGGMMNKSTMVASNDGGVIILSGQKLTKYDANLNVTKEVSIVAEEPAKEAPKADKVDHSAHH